MQLPSACSYKAKHRNAKPFNANGSQELLDKHRSRECNAKSCIADCHCARNMEII